MRAALLISDGFEEAETVIIYDILRRTGIDVEIIACSPSGLLTTKAYFSLSVNADKRIEDIMESVYDAVIIPGGPESTLSLAKNDLVIRFIQRHDLLGRWICALCSAPVRVLGANQLLKARAYTCSGDLWQACRDGKYTGEETTVDRNLITGKGLGVSFEFAFRVAKTIVGKTDAIVKEAQHIYFKGDIA